jgi:hypothetical protein
MRKRDSLALYRIVVFFFIIYHVWYHLFSTTMIKSKRRDLKKINYFNYENWLLVGLIWAKLEIKPNG